MSFEVPEYTIKDNRIKKDTELMILSDLHGNSYGENNESLSFIIDCYKPDALIVLGDMISCRSKEAYYGSLGMFRDLTGRYPVYFVNGNHEEYHRRKHPELYVRYMRRLKKLGVKLLFNTSDFLSEKGIGLYGLRLPLEAYVKFASYRFDFLDFDELFPGKDNGVYNILLSHNPYVAKVEGIPFDLVLSGHMHGGGIRFPGIGAVIGPNLFPFPRLTKGEYEVNGVKLIVSAGLGDHFPMIRMNNPRTLVRVILQSY